MEDWCNYSDLPSPDWWERLDLIDLTKKCVRDDLHSEVEQIILLSNKRDLIKIEQILQVKKIDSFVISKVCIELDFLSSKLKYLKKLDNNSGSFGIDLEMIPDLVAEWRNEKINDIIKTVFPKP